MQEGCSFLGERSRARKESLEVTSCVLMVFLPLWHSHPEISLLSGKVVSVSQISKFCRTRYSGSKRKDYSARAQSMGKKTTLFFFFLESGKKLLSL